MENRYPGWTPDGVTWYTHEGGEMVVTTPETYTTNELDAKNVVYTEQQLCGCGHPDVRHTRICMTKTCLCVK